MKPEMILTHQFVEFIPKDLEDETIYVSIDFATAVHKCACGCGREVITPFTPTDWKLIFDGETVSLEPSIGNWSFPCQSHYWIRGNKVKWARQWSKEEINAGRAFDSLKKQSYIGDKQTVTITDKTTGIEGQEEQPRKSLWQKLKERLF